MNIRKVTVATLVSMSLSACAGGYAGQSYQPIIDPYGSPGKNPAAYQSDMAQCQALASQRDQVTDAAKGGLLGAGIGAAGGAIAGFARGGHALSGAGIGSLAGLLAGGAYSAFASNENKQNVVMSCMQNRGWSVLGR